MLIGERAYGKPAIVNREGKTTINIERVPLNKRLIDEYWLQELIRKQPDLLPIEDIEPVFAPLIPIGREVSTNAGSIDNLFISPDGYLTIVETKLWRNPEARREVVGQIIDYAKDISGWNFDELNKKVKEYNLKYENCNYGIIDTIRKAGYKISNESKMVDLICRNLKKGRVLLLIVGDGIHQGVEEMVEFLNQTPNMLYTLALIELQLYKIENSEDYLIIPQTIMRTREIVRAVVKVEGASIESVQISVDTSDDSSRPNKRKRFTLTEEEFYEELSKNVESKYVEGTKELLAKAEEIGCKIQWRQSSVMVRYKSPNIEKQIFTFFGIITDGNAFEGWFRGQLERVGLDPKIAEDFYTESERLFDNASWQTTVKVHDICDNMDDLINIIKATIHRIEEGFEKITLKSVYDEREQ
jgi:uncharacterized protein YlzI (FlbEa/FlbD family)